MISEIDDYFAKGCGRCPRFATPECSTQQWAAGLAELRQICLSCGLTETVKWGHPCYVHANRNIAIIGAFRGDFRITFCNAALLNDADNILEPRGPNTRFPDIIRFRENGDVSRLKPSIIAYLEEAMAFAEAGIRPQKSATMPDCPAELGDALGADLELNEAFQRLTPGRQKSYLLNLNSAKKPETRLARISRFRERILAGKGALER